MEPFLGSDYLSYIDIYSTRKKFAIAFGSLQPNHSFYLLIYSSKLSSHL